MLWLFCYSYRPYKKILCGEKKQKVEGIQQIALLSLIALTLISDVSLIYMFSFFSVALTPDNVFWQHKFAVVDQSFSKFEHNISDFSYYLVVATTATRITYHDILLT